MNKTKVCALSLVNTLLGDVDGSEKLNTRDLVALRRYIVGGYDVIIDRAVADIDGDGLIDARDVVLLRWCIAG